MAIQLKKGASLNLKKETPSLKRILIGLGWEASGEQDIDLDAVVFILNENNRVRSDEDFIFYNQPESSCGSVKHQGDERSGGAAGEDAEVIEVNLAQLPLDVQSIVVCVTIYDDDNQNLKFGLVQNAYIRLLDAETSKPLARYDLTEDASTATAVFFGRLIRVNSEWNFQALGQGETLNLGSVARRFGVNI